MVFYSIDQDNSSAVFADKSADLGGIREWKEEVKRVRSTREAGSNPPRGMSSRASSRNVGRQSINHAAPVSALKPASATSSGPASTDNVRIVSQPIVFPSRNLDEIKETSSEVNVNGLKLDQSRPGLCSTDNSQKLAQLSVSTDGLDKTSTSNEAYRQPDLLERLNSIYGSVLVVDNITVAKEVVGMLTNKYRHLVHACDTEVLF